MSFIPFIPSEKPATVTRALTFLAISVLAAGSLLAAEQNTPSTKQPTLAPSQEGNLRRGSADAPTSAQDPNLLLREVHYDGHLTESQARFTVDIDAESIGKGECSITLFEGD